MEFRPTRVHGAQLIESQVFRDERGTFQRSFCQSTFAGGGIPMTVRQTSISTNAATGTLRGLHYQRLTHPEAKLVCCVAGAVYDVIVDLRQGSPTYRDWYGVELSAGSGHALYIPPGVAHGFLTLEGNSVVYYVMDADHQPSAGTGVRWDDPAFGIVWPARPAVIAPRDAGYPDFDP
ncbi:MAG: dTDP-4-dehydrorhamnose 3,5-epimerase family protein [Alphaproteobacteria bacterium]|nr:dTDP-4-dehydrorhamnose 3,5-epimerase family protein [Alphaproteobacteria bacterium]